MLILAGQHDCRTACDGARNLYSRFPNIRSLLSPRPRRFPSQYYVPDAKRPVGANCVQTRSTKISVGQLSPSIHAVQWATKSNKTQQWVIRRNAYLLRPTHRASRPCLPDYLALALKARANRSARTGKMWMGRGKGLVPPRIENRTSVRGSSLLSL